MRTRAAPTLGLAASIFAVWAQPSGGVEINPAKLELKAGQAVTFSVTLADGKVALGRARLGKFGSMQPSEGEMTVGVSARDKTLYEDVVVIEKTATPVDFVATGLVGNIKIDEIVLHGRLDEPVTKRIGATSWTVLLNSFEAGSLTDGK